jgi:hypothetical protein
MQNSTKKHSANKASKHRRTLTGESPTDANQAIDVKHSAPLSTRKKKEVDGAHHATGSLRALDPSEKKQTSHYGSFRLNLDGLKPDGWQGPERSPRPSPRGDSNESGESEKTPTSPGWSRRTLHSPRRRKTERSAPTSPSTSKAEKLLESIRHSQTRLEDCKNERGRLLQTQGSSDEMKELFREAQDARVDHEVAVNQLYDLLGLSTAFNEYSITHWSDWPLEGAVDDDEVAKVTRASPRAAVRADASSSPRVQIDLPADLLSQLRNSADDEIRATIDSAKDSVRECDKKLKAINSEGRRIDEQIGRLTEQREKLKHEKSQSVQERDFHASFLERAEKELVRRGGESEKAPERPLIPSVPVTPRSPPGSNQ